MAAGIAPARDQGIGTRRRGRSGQKRLGWRRDGPGTEGPSGRCGLRAEGHRKGGGGRRLGRDEGRLEVIEDAENATHRPSAHEMRGQLRPGGYSRWAGRHQEKDVIVGQSQGRRWGPHDDPSAAGPPCGARKKIEHGPESMNVLVWEASGRAGKDELTS